jgi:hypothetical protein
VSSIVVVGGGWSGCAAALTAALAGEDVFLLERTDMLLGTGLAGGIMKNNGRLTVTEEMVEMGGGAIFQAIDKTYLHRDLEFPGQVHASIYDVTKIEGAIRHSIERAGVKIFMKSRVKDVVVTNRKIRVVLTDDGIEIKGDVFIETTGSAGPLQNCKKFGNGCAMCILRCPSFGGRVSISEKSGIKEKKLIASRGKYGRISGACSLLKSSLSKSLSEDLTRYGKLEIPLPKKMIQPEMDSVGKTCPQYGEPDFERKLIFLDNGHAKLMTPFLPLQKLRQISGLENAIYADPLSGGIGNSIRYLSITPTDIYLRAKGVENLFCAGEKIGPIAGHTEAIVTGILAGKNAVLLKKKNKLFSLPIHTALGDFIFYVNSKLEKENSSEIFTFSGSVYFERMKKLGLYKTDQEEIYKNIGNLRLRGVFS